MKRTYEIRLRSTDPNPVIIAVARSVVDAKRQSFAILPGWYHPCSVIAETEESLDNRAQKD